MRPLVAAILFLLAAGCGRGDDSDVMPDRADGLTERCEKALLSTHLVTVKPRGPLAGSGHLRFGTDAGVIGSVLGVAGTPDGTRLRVLDGVANDVKVFDALTGELLNVFSRFGHGPGELAEIAGMHAGSRSGNQLAAAPSGLAFVKGASYLHVFGPDGDFVDRISVDGLSAGPLALNHVAAWGDSAAVFSTNRIMELDRPYEERVRTSLLSLSATEAGLDTAAVAELSTQYALLGSFRGLPPRNPFSRWYQRLWDANHRGLLAVNPLTFPGICVFDRDLRLLGAHRVAVDSIPTDAEIRRAILAQMGKTVGNAPPMMGGGWEDFYQAWPDRLPYYTDIVIGEDSTVWARRPTGVGTAVADRYDVTRGYIDTVELDELPLVAGRGCGYWVEEDLEAGFYGVGKRCFGIPGPDSSDGEAARHVDGPPQHPDLRVEMRRAVTAQMTFQASHGRYAENAGDLGIAFHPRVVIEVAESTGEGFAILGESEEEALSCGFRRGVTGPADLELEEGRIHCWPSNDAR